MEEENIEIEYVEDSVAMSKREIYWILTELQNLREMVMVQES